MGTSNRTGAIRLTSRTAIAVATSLLMASVAMAQSSEGSLSGSAKAEATITVVNVETGQTRTVKADKSGNFALTKMVPGKYKVTTEGISKDVFVAVGTTSSVSLQAETLERIDIKGSRVRTIDMSSTETNSVFTAESIRELPVARNPNAISLLAPGVVKGDPGMGTGDLPSFGGASVGENGYYINGFDVTNIRNFLSYAELPFDAVGQQQVKAGGYGAEYGRSLGGVVSIVTKRGTNEWKGGASAYWTPSEFRSKGKNVVNLDKDTIDTQTKLPAYTVFGQDSIYDRLNYNAYIGGPVIKDKLFVFALVEGRHNRDETFGQTRSTIIRDSRPRGLLKVDFQPNDSHSFELTAIDNKRERSFVDYERDKAGSSLMSGVSDAQRAKYWYATEHAGVAGQSEEASGGTVAIGKYTGYLTDSLTVSALAGRVKNQQPLVLGSRQDGADCPTVYNVGATKALGCWNGIFPGAPGRDPKAPATDDDIRTSWRLDLEYSIGSHVIRGGLDNQKFTSSQAGGSSYSGGAYWRYFVSTGTVNGVAVPAGTPVVRKRTYLSTSGTFEVENKAWYLEDSWQATKNLLVYGGVRGESFDNRNGDGVSFVKADNLLAPRAGFSLNALGDGSTKVYGSFGRYYIPVASNSNIRMTRAEGSSESWYTYNGMDPVTAAPQNVTQVGTVTGGENFALPDPATVADTKLRPMNQDEWILGIQRALSKDWTVGAKFVNRKINDGMDDFCGAYAIKNWAVANGYPSYKATDVASCILLNPGRDVSLKVDVKNDGVLKEVTIPASYFGLEPYKRTYKALELTLEHPFDGTWGGNFSYVWSRSKGSAEGYVQSTLQQEDAGITQDFDFGSFSHGSSGYLPNDRTHVFKFFGNYAVAESFKVGATAIISSGRPKSCIGFVPKTVADFNKVDGHSGSGDYTSASSYYCLDDNGKTQLTQRGAAGRTPWTGQLDLQFSFTPKTNHGRLTLQANVFNVLNSQKAVRLNEVRDFSRADTNAQWATPPAPGKLNPNYDQPQNFQSPRSIQFSARYEF